MKKLITLLLALIGGVQIWAIDYYVVGDVAGGWTGNPITSEKALKMLTSDNNIYYYDITPDGSDKYFVIVDGEGDNGDDWPGLNAHKYGNVSQDVTGNTFGVSLTKGLDKSFHITEADGSKKFRVVFNESAQTMSVVKFVDRYVAGSFTPSGAEEEAGFFTDKWSAASNKLQIQEDGTYAITFDNTSLTTGTISFKFTDGEWGTGHETTNNGTKNVAKSKTYNITFSLPYWNDLNNYTLTVREPFSGYYIVDNTNNPWKVMDELSVDGTSYSATFSNKNGYEFIITPNTNVDAGETVLDWNACIRPTNYTMVTFQNYSAETPYSETGGSQNWTINNSGLPDVTFTYDSDQNKWSFTSADASCAIGAAGYATYSMGDKYMVTGADKVYTVTNNNAETVTLTEWDASTIFPANTGVIIKGSSAATIKAVASDATPTTIGTNYLVGSGNSDATITAGPGIYIFNWDGTASSVGFYLANSGTLDAHKAYLNVSGAGAREFLGFDFGNEETAIETMPMNENNGSTYSLSGQRFAQPTKGLYIVNGKKVIVK